MTDEQKSGLEFLEDPSEQGISRRDFFKTAGSGLFVLFTVGDSLFSAQERQGRPQRTLPADFNAFLRIGEDGRVACYTGKIEMGQGVVTSLAQMLSDELDVALDDVDMVMGDTDLCPWDMGTFGSMSTRFFGPALRSAGAEGRRVLLELASERLKVPVESLATERGSIFDRSKPDRRVTYGELARGRKIERHLGEPVAV